MNKRVPPRGPTEGSHYGHLEKITGQTIDKRHNPLINMDSCSESSALYDKSTPNENIHN